MAIISAPALLVGSNITGPGALAVENGRITDVLDHVPSTDTDHVRLRTGLLTAGMLDLQVNGCYGVDFASAQLDAMATVRSAIAHTGVTAFAPTLITAEINELTTRIDRLAALLASSDPGQGARLLGIHVEGPYLSALHTGAHDPALITTPSEESIEQLLAGARDGVIAIVTLAPECAGALDAIRRLTAAGIVCSVGHSDATAEVMAQAADAGATMVTHLFNAQRGLHHREPGVPGAALADTRYRMGIIVDFHHVAKDIVRLAFLAAPDRMMLVTDSVAAAGMQPGTYTLGDVTTEVSGLDQPPRRVDGTLAGSTLSLDLAVRNVVSLGIDRTTALLAATRVPADALGRTDLGRLRVGAHADLVHWDDALLVKDVWIAGVHVPTGAS